MAINSDKLLNKSSELHRRYGGRLVMKEDLQKKMVGGGPTNIVLSKKSIKDIEGIKVNVIKIENILKGTLAAEKKSLDEKKRQESGKRREKQEEKLETKPQAEKGPIKMPKIPRMGFLDWVKNFIGNVILGYFAVRMIDFLPKITPILKFLGSAADFVIDVGGKLLDGLVTFIDWGYKAYDASRGFVKNLFNENGVKQFDQLSGLLNQFLNLAIIAGMVAAGSGGGPGGRGGGAAAAGRPRPGLGGRPKVTTSGGGGVGRPDIRNPLRQRPTVTTGGKPQFRLPGTAPKITGSSTKGILSTVRPFLKRIPLPVIGALIDFGLSVALGENPGRAAFRAIGAGLLGAVGAAAGSVVPVAGNFIGGLLGGFAGDAIGGALYDAFFGGKSLPKGKTTKKAGGGITRGGKSKTKAKRTIGKNIREKKKYKRVIPRKPGEVEIEPGADVGGEDKIFGIFPNPLKAVKKVIDAVNPFGVVKTAGEDLGKTDYFGPILAITSKITLGQKPSQKDYDNVGLGINMLISKGIQEKQLKGGVVAAFAEGGLVDPDVLSAAETGGDISNWVAKTFKGEIESNAQKTLRMIRDNAKKEKPEASEDYKDSEGSDPSLGISPDGATVTGGNADFWTLVAIARMEDSDPQGSADVAQSIYNRVASGIYGGKTIKEIVLRQGQYEPTWKYPKRGRTGVPNPEWHAIKDLKTASIATGISESDLQKTAAALKNSKYQQEARKFIGGRTDFMGGSNKPGPGDIRRTENAPNNFFGWFVGPAAKAYGAKNPGPAKVPQLGDVVVMGGGGSFGQEPLGKGYGSAGSKIAGELGRYVKKKLRQGPDFSLVHRHPEHPPYSLSSGHSSGSLHYQGRAVDIGAYTYEQGPILKVISEFNKMKGVRPAQLLHGKNEPSGHSDHVHVAYEEGGETLPYPHLATISEKGKEIVVDNDSAYSSPQVRNMLLAINQATGYRGVMQAIQQYAPYDSLAPQTIVMESPDTSMDDNYSDSGSSGLSIAFVGGGNDDPFDTLYQGG